MLLVRVFYKLACLPTSCVIVLCWCVLYNFDYLLIIFNICNFSFSKDDTVVGSAKQNITSGKKRFRPDGHTHHSMTTT